MQLQDKINFEAQLCEGTILAAHDSQRKRPGREMFQYNIDYTNSQMILQLLSNSPRPIA